MVKILKYFDDNHKMRKERNKNNFFWYKNGLPLIAGAFEILSSLPSSSAEELIYGRLSRDYQDTHHQHGGGSGGDNRRGYASSSSADRRQQQSGGGNGGYLYGQQPLVHTFETQGSCMRRCALPCVIQNVEDLMMPRWICPSSQQSSEIVSSSNAVTQQTSSFSIPFDNQFLLLLVPLGLIFIIALVIIWVRRSSSSSTNDDEFV